MGDFDLVPSVLIKIGFEILFDQVAIQPGKPTVFGRYENKFVFGIPGNPVSSFICFEIFVKRISRRCDGLEGSFKKFSRCSWQKRLNGKKINDSHGFPLR